MEKLDKRFKHIYGLLGAFAAGDFDRRAPVSEKGDEVDAFIGGLHMMGEELKEATVSRELFHRIFDTVSEMLLVLDRSGAVILVNAAVTETLGFTGEMLVGGSVDRLGASGSLFRELSRRRGPADAVRLWGHSLVTMEGGLVPVEMEVKRLPGGMWLLIARDVRAAAEAENRLLRAVIDTQEIERARLARDVHDGLSQRLTAARFLLSALARQELPAEVAGLLAQAEEALEVLLQQMRGVCNQLMPMTLEDFGLEAALGELCAWWERTALLRCVLRVGVLPVLDKRLEIDLFRVAQEFMTNAVRHGRATVVWIRIDGSGAGVSLHLRDNGKGFEPATAQGGGMGLRNMYSRIKSHGGTLKLRSQLGAGTTVYINV